MSDSHSLDDSLSTRLNRMLSYNLTQMIYVAARLNIADLLAQGPRRVEVLAEQAGAHPPSLYRLLRALASQGLFAEDDQGRFGLTPLAVLLRSDVEGSLHPFALSYGEPWWWNSWGRLLHSIQTGETAFDSVHGESLFEYLDTHREAAAIFDANMKAMTAQESGALVAAYDFSATRVLVDIGAGHGALATAILQAYPQARAILFDRPAVVEGARARLEAAGLASRCEFVGGSFFESIPGGGDTYILKDIIHDWDDERSVAILRNCLNAMETSARLLIVERVIPGGNEPAEGKMIDISMLVMTGGRERTQAEYRSLLSAAGLKFARYIQTDAGHGIIETEPIS